MNFTNAARWRMVAVLAIAACGSFLIACGGDDDAEVGQLQITASGKGNATSFEVNAEELPAGATEITFVNDSEGSTDAQLVYSAEDRTDEEVIAELGNAFEGEAVADWFEGGGGPGNTPAGETSVVTQVLEPGTYWVVGQNLPDTPGAKFIVTDADGADLPDAEGGTVEAVDYSFSGELSAGENSILLENNGEEWHHFIAAKLVDDASIEDVEEFFRTEEGQPPLEGGPGEPNPIESTVIEGGASQLVNTDLEAGRYAFMCFISDKEGGRSHIELGMLSEVEVTE